MKLWPKSVHGPIRFHDLRATTATLLARAGVPLVVAQRILRHSDPRLTANVYSHVDLGDLRGRAESHGHPCYAHAHQCGFGGTACPPGVPAPVTTEKEGP